MTRYLQHRATPEASCDSRCRGTKYLQTVLNGIGRRKPAPGCPVPTGSRDPELTSSLPPPSSSSFSFPPPAAVLQFLQLLLHEVGLGRGLRELQHTANNDKSKELLLQPWPHAAAPTLDLQPRSLPCSSDNAKAPWRDPRSLSLWRSALCRQQCRQQDVWALEGFLISWDRDVTEIYSHRPAPAQEGICSWEAEISPGKPGDQLGLLLSTPATKATCQFENMGRA